MKKKHYECDGGSLAIGSADLRFNVINCFGDGRHAVEVYERSRANHNRKLVFRGSVSGSEIKVYDYDCLSKEERKDPAHTLFTLSGRYGIYAVEDSGTIILEKWD